MATTSPLPDPNSEQSKNNNNNNNKNKNNDDENSLFVISDPTKLLNRHFSTIGIDDVFLSRPSSPSSTSSSSSSPAHHYHHPLLSTYLTTEGCSESFSSWEFVGTIKTNPEDFVVREVFPTDRTIPGMSKEDLSLLRVANIIIPNDKMPTQNLVSINIIIPEEKKKDNDDDDDGGGAKTSTTTVSSSEPNNMVSTEEKKPAATTPSNVNSVEEKAGDTTATPNQLQTTTTPLEDITSFLRKAIQSHEQHKTTSMSTKTTTTTTSSTDEQQSLVSSLRNLHDQALERIKIMASSSSSSSSGNDDEKNATDSTTTAVWIPSICSSSSSSSTTSNTTTTTTTGSSADDKAARGAFHRAFKVEFPLLTAQSGQWSKSDKEGDDNSNGGGSGRAGQWMKVKADEKYDELIPFLLSPEIDLPELYRFEKRGFTENNDNDGKGLPPPKRRRKHHDGGGVSFDRNLDESSCKIILRLKPGVSKEDRRSLHRIISTRNKLFGTSTINDVPVVDDGDSNTIENSKELTAREEGDNNGTSKEDTNGSDKPKTTVAVVVSWQKHLIRSNNKRKQAKNDSKKSGGGNPNDKYPNLLCVFRKRRKEHLTALQKIAKCIRCRQSDIGVAGIKDMHAVTYQFCTIRNMKAKRASHGIRQLRQQHGIEMGNLCQVDWTLNNGDLEGNQFEIVVRNVHRIAVEKSTGEQQPAIEKLIPCSLQHVQEMAERVKQHGFINFYGEQRLGAPGNRSVVGVRSFEIGKAMLQGRYSDAIDLLMTGRLVCRGENEREGEDILRVRQAWKDSGGDPTTTLKAFHGKDIFTREKIVLKGLQRYGKDRPLDALRCLAHSMRIFWINAYQSLVWNTVASERIKKFGNRVLKGDLYLDGNDSTRSDVKVVESDDDSSVELSQVVLPLPGNNVKYPENELGDYYKKILEKDGVQFEKGGSAESTAKGSYRRVIVHPDALTVSEDAEATFKLTFQLPKGSYATMLLRELMLTTATR